MAHIFDETLLKGIKSGQIPARTGAARKWYRQTAKKMGAGINERSVMRDKDRLTTKPYVGNMYLFYYDAKHKATLPYYDKLPLIFPFAMAKGGFYGINMHYLPLPLRAKLMDKLYDFATDDKFDDKTRLNLAYQTLNAAAKYKYFKPCVKRYLTGQLKSRFLYIHPTEWDIALFLPLERFQGASKGKVYQDSRNIIKG